MSQVWAFCPPPCRNTTRGGSSPHFSALIGPRVDALDRRQRTRRAGLLGVLLEERELVEADEFVVGSHMPTLQNGETAVRSGFRFETRSHRSFGEGKGSSPR